MNDFLQKDLGSTLLSVVVLLGWLALGFTSLRIILLFINKTLKQVSKLSNKEKWYFLAKFNLKIFTNIV